jgi:hypothetical protein
MVPESHWALVRVPFGPCMVPESLVALVWCPVPFWPLYGARFPCGPCMVPDSLWCYGARVPLGPCIVHESLWCYGARVPLLLWCMLVSLPVSKNR